MCSPSYWRHSVSLQNWDWSMKSDGENRDSGKWQVLKETQKWQLLVKSLKPLSSTTWRPLNVKCIDHVCPSWLWFPYLHPTCPHLPIAVSLVLNPPLQILCNLKFIQNNCFAGLHNLVQWQTNPPKQTSPLNSHIWIRIWQDFNVLGVQPTFWCRKLPLPFLSFKLCQRDPVFRQKQLFARFGLGRMPFVIGEH